MCSRVVHGCLLGRWQWWRRDGGSRARGRSRAAGRLRHFHGSAPPRARPERIRRCVRCSWVRDRRTRRRWTPPLSRAPKVRTLLVWLVTARRLVSEAGMHVVLSSLQVVYLIVQLQTLLSVFLRGSRATTRIYWYCISREQDFGAASRPLAARPRQLSVVRPPSPVPSAFVQDLPCSLRSRPDPNQAHGLHWPAMKRCDRPA